MADCSWLAGTRWYVPPENLLAYLCDASLRRRTAVADQTLWAIRSASDGRFEGSSETTLWLPAPTGELSPLGPSRNALDGIVDESGEVTITFTPEDPDQAPTVGYGQLRTLGGEARFEMQMATGSPALAMHWAYMTRSRGDEAPDAAPPPRHALDPELRSDEWRWLSGSAWNATDRELFPAGCRFTIGGYRNGYLWGEGATSAEEPLRVAGSVTPEGSLYLLFSVADAAAVHRRGIIEAERDGARMSWTDGRALMLTHANPLSTSR